MKKRALIFKLKISEFLISLFIILILSYLTYQRNFIWKTDYSLWRDVVKKSSNKARPHYNLGISYFYRKMYNEALANYQEAMRLEPIYASDSDVQYNLGISYYHKKMYDKAIVHYKEAQRLKPDNPDNFYNLGLVYADKGLYDQAIYYYKGALSLDPFDAEARYNLGKAYYDIGSFNEAVLEFKEALRLNPNLSEPHLNLGVIYLNHFKNKQRALFHLENSLRLSPNQPQAAEIKRVISELTRF